MTQTEITSPIVISKDFVKEALYKKELLKLDVDEKAKILLKFDLNSKWAYLI